MDRFGKHNFLLGYEYHRDKYRTEVTAGDDPDCLCGYWWLTIAPMDITTMRETQGPLDIETVERTTFVNDRTQGFYVQDQIDIAPQVKVNLGYRLDDYKRAIDREGGLPFTPVRRDQVAHSYRAGIVYAPRFDQQIYFATATSFTPVNTVPARRVAARAEHGPQLRGRPPLAGLERPRRHHGRRLLHRAQQRDRPAVGRSASFRSASRTRRGWMWT